MRALIFNVRGLIKGLNFDITNRSLQLTRYFAITSNMSQTPKENTWRDSHSKEGAYVRPASSFRDTVTADGSRGFKAESGRYHLYVSLACPWAHRTLIVRALKGLENAISYTVVDYFMDKEGWKFNPEVPQCEPDSVNNCKRLREVYEIASPGYTGRITVPVLWDKTKKTIVNNESSEIIRMMNNEFDAFCPTSTQKSLDLYPESLQPKIDNVNEWIYRDINNGVYKSGFAKSQKAYDEAVTALFAALDQVEDILSKNRYLAGEQFTEADVRLFTTLIRFDPVYVGHFKCNKKRIVDYKNMWAYTREIYQMPGIAATVDLEHITKHYQMSHEMINPFRIVAIGPDIDYMAPHGRDAM